MASLLVLIMVMSSVAATAHGDLPRLDHQPKDHGSLDFLVVGDWGRRGSYNQSQVAFQMGRIGQKQDIDFVISTGDNFYNNGLRGVDDRLFEQSFTNIYTAKSLQKPWYTVLGNHDYRGNVEAQLSNVLRKIDHRWICMRSFLLNAELADFFFIDTTPFVDQYFTDPQGQNYDWSDVHPQRQYTSKILKNLESALKESTSKWKIVVGHHPIRSIGPHGDTVELVNLLLPILETYEVDFYMNGHDHCLEHISSTTSHIQFLTSGAGSKAWQGKVEGLKQDGVNFYYNGQGFMSVQLTKNNVKIVFYDVYGKVLYSWNKFKQLHSTI